MLFERKDKKKETPLFVVSNSITYGLAFAVSAILITGWTTAKSHNFRLLFDEMAADSASSEAINEPTEPPQTTTVTITDTSAPDFLSEQTVISVEASEPDGILEIVVTTVPVTQEQPQTVSVEAEEPLLIDLNTATVEQLMKLDGIGEAKAEAIIEYRKQFLCFIDKRELNDVEGIGEKLYDKIKDNVYVGATLVPSPIYAERPEETSTEYIEKININTADLETLMTIKGIGETKAKAIIEYREAEGNFVMIEEITDVKGIGEGIFEKIKPYICIK